MYCSNCGKTINGKCLTDTSGIKYCSTKCHWEATHLTLVEIKDYHTIKFKCGQCDEGQYYSKGEPIQCPYCDAKDRQVLVEVNGISKEVSNVSNPNYPNTQ